jgi:hypothetical protein
MVRGGYSGAEQTAALRVMLYRLGSEDEATTAAVAATAALEGLYIDDHGTLRAIIAYARARQQETSTLDEQPSEIREYVRIMGYTDSAGELISAAVDAILRWAASHHM